MLKKNKNSTKIAILLSSPSYYFVCIILQSFVVLPHLVVLVSSGFVLRPSSSFATAFIHNKNTIATTTTTTHRKMSSTTPVNNDRTSATITTNIVFDETSSTFDTTSSTTLLEKDIKTTIIIGKKDVLLEKSSSLCANSGWTGFDDSFGSNMIDAMINSIDNDSGGCTTTFVPIHNVKDNTSTLHQIKICTLPNKVSRNNHSMSPHTITTLLQSNCPSKDNVRIVVYVGDDCSPGPIASAIGKSFPLFSKKTTRSSSSSDNTPTASSSRNVYVTFVNNGPTDSEASKQVLKACQVVSDGVRLAQRLSDTHPDELTTDSFSEEVHNMVANELKDDALPGSKITVNEIIGDDLQKMGYGGIYNVGKCATCPPRLIIVSYEPPAGEDEVQNIALVGKGIVYDTGGLGIKTPKANMCGMKHDMGGAAGLFGGFVSAVKLGCRHRVTLVLCIAENAIGPNAVRNDDIITLYSGKTVEINNSDAEGRLVLGDGVAHVTKHISNLDLVVDMATLTGAQSVTTGKKHSSILTPSKELENKIVDCGLYSGDLCYPILYFPESLMDEFKSSVADMKNSVANRSNAQCSCAGHFIESHLNENYKGDWLHIDMAGPSLDPKDGSRSTGYGVGLILSLLDVPGF